MIRKMLTAATNANLRLRVSCDGEIDYQGSSVTKALEALNACDETMLHVQEERAGKWHSIGSALFIAELDKDEQIADAGGWCNNWLDENMEF